MIGIWFVSSSSFILNHEGAGYFSPSYFDDKLFVCSYNHLTVLNSKTGETLWKRIHSAGSNG